MAATNGLPKAKKMTDPTYQEVKAGAVPVAVKEGETVRVLAGEYAGTKGAIDAIGVGSLYLDVSLSKGTRFSCPVPDTFNAFAFLLGGAGQFGATSTRVKKSEIAAFGRGNSVEAVAGESGARFILVAGTPLEEPVARGGPFVMNTQEEIREAWREDQEGTFVKKGAVVDLTS